LFFAKNPTKQAYTHWGVFAKRKLQIAPTAIIAVGIEFGGFCKKYCRKPLAQRL